MELKNKAKVAKRSCVSCKDVEKVSKLSRQFTLKCWSDNNGISVRFIIKV